MGKLILGIIAVVCLEIAFVAHVTVNSEFEVPAVALNASTRDSNDHLTSLSELDQYGLTDPSAASVNDSRIGLQRIRVTPVPVSGRQQYTARLSDKRFQRRSGDLSARRIDGPSDSRTRSERAALGESVVIFYDREPEISYNDTKTSNTKTIVLPAAEKNSFLAKALNVIKKPWDWTKFAASKLR